MGLAKHYTRSDGVSLKTYRMPRIITEAFGSDGNKHSFAEEGGGCCQSA